MYTTMIDMSNDFLSLQKPSASYARDLETVLLRSVDMEAPDELPRDDDSKVATRAKGNGPSTTTHGQQVCHICIVSSLISFVPLIFCLFVNFDRLPKQLHLLFLSFPFQLSDCSVDSDTES